MKIFITIILILIALIAIVILTFYLLWFIPLRKKEPGFEYVHVDEDGSVRELDKDEIEYLSTEFEPADGGRPYIKNRYSQLTPDKKICGYILRRRVPRHLEIRPIKT
ncbi:MAG: hypothetical protein REI64_10425 [Pedobacter sp.]|uniref:hypothetical protein n=1 Tax=Pedobacter sp. TaxID=1411316 RepID=UPI002807829C|nr:hypothetical protein [Pedobacter sp.]MDQ8005204.1 hypothetical protein [Pedobacter sp.]